VDPLPLPNCYWVLPGKLLAGEHPAGATPQLTRERLSRLLAAGVTYFLDLTHPGEVAPYDQGLPVEIDFLRRPIHDHGIPSEPGHMAETLTCLRQALQEGGIVYLHCRAGIGRTATVAGCLLVEHGLSGEEALAELNRLWQQSPRAQDWPLVPETDEQADYIRHWSERAQRAGDPLLEPATLTAARGLRERFQGALLGLATGDAVAAATQYGRPGRFAPVGDMLGGGPFDLPRGGWSDDTAMALCLAESLLERDGFDARDQVERYRRWQQEAICRPPDNASESRPARRGRLRSRAGAASPSPAHTTRKRRMPSHSRASSRWCCISSRASSKRPGRLPRPRESPARPRWC